MDQLSKRVLYSGESYTVANVQTSGLTYRTFTSMVGGVWVD